MFTNTVDNSFLYYFFSTKKVLLRTVPFSLYFTKAAFICFLLFSNFLFSQKKYILIDSETQKEYKKKDSLSATRFLDSLSANQYFFTKIVSVKDSSTEIRVFFDKGKSFQKVKVFFSEKIRKDLEFKENMMVTSNLDSLKQTINTYYYKKGFVFNRVQSKFIKLEQQIPWIQLDVLSNQQRTINGFVLKGYQKVPKRFIKNLEKEFNGKPYTEKNLLQIQSSLINHPFISLERTPQTLFTKDSTNIYLFLQKKKSNSFDGIVGFGNNNSEKFTFNGTLNLNFKNIFNGFESISLYWQRNPDKAQNFDFRFDIPYFFGSNIGTGFNVNIFRQDTTFAVVKMHPVIYYHLNSRQKLGFRGTFETSSVTDSLYAKAKDYTKTGFGAWYDYTIPTDIELFLYKLKIRAEADYLSTNYTQENINSGQRKLFLFGEFNQKIKGNHYLNLKGETSVMDSQNAFTINELMRFGGWNTFRGFNENSLLADFYYYGNAEYRYLVNNQAFFDVFMQYGQFNNNSLGLKPKLYSFGVGFNFFLPVGLMSFQIANGNEVGNPIKFGNTKIHWGILARF